MRTMDNGEEDSSPTLTDWDFDSILTSWDFDLTLTGWDFDGDVVELRRINDSNRHSSREATSADRHFDSLRRFWNRHIHIRVPHDACRDHLANERTFLGFLRTSQAVAMLGCVITQFYRIQQAPDPDNVLGYFEIAVPLASACHVSAILVALIGCWRCLKWQNQIVRGMAISSGWELLVTFVLIGLLLLTCFVLAIAIAIRTMDG